jgi:hypothetical protein
MAEHDEYGAAHWSRWPLELTVGTATKNAKKS